MRGVPLEDFLHSAQWRRAIPVEYVATPHFCVRRSEGTVARKC